MIYDMIIWLNNSWPIEKTELDQEIEIMLF